MPNYKCEFCNSILSSKPVLKKHKETAKKCIVEQEKLKSRKIHEAKESPTPIINEPDKVELFKCQLCFLNMVKKSYKEHIKSCKRFDDEKHIYKRGIVYEKEGDSLVIYKRIEIKEKEHVDILNENKFLKEKLKDVEEKLSELKIEIAEYKDKRLEFLEKKVEKPINISIKTANFASVIKQYTSKPICMDKKVYADIVNEKLETSHMKKGEAGMAIFYINEVIKNKDGNIYMVCPNKRTNDLKYMNENNEIISDPGGAMLLNIVNDRLMPAVKTKAAELTADLSEDAKKKLAPHNFKMGCQFISKLSHSVAVDKNGCINSTRQDPALKILNPAEEKSAKRKRNDTMKV